MKATYECLTGKETPMLKRLTEDKRATEPSLTEQERAQLIAAEHRLEKAKREYVKAKRKAPRHANGSPVMTDPMRWALTDKQIARAHLATIKQRLLAAAKRQAPVPSELR